MYIRRLIPALWLGQFVDGLFVHVDGDLVFAPDVHQHVVDLLLSGSDGHLFVITFWACRGAFDLVENIFPEVSNR